MIRLAVGIPAYSGRVSAGHVMQAAQLAWAWNANRLPAPLVMFVDTAGVDKARNILVAKARDAGVDWLLMCDADTYFLSPPAIAAMFRTAIDRKAAVIGAPVKMRKRDGYNVSRGESYALVPESEFRGKVIEVDRIGTAFTAVDVKWLTAAWPESPWFMFQHISGPKPETVGEDYWFCNGVKKRGGLILADGRFEPTHVGASDEFAMASQVGADAFEV